MHFASPTKLSVSGRAAKPFVFDSKDIPAALRMMPDLGIFGLDKIARGGLYGLDTIQQPITTASIPNLVQFFQNWLVGTVGVITKVMVADELMGINTSGAFEEQEVVQSILENTANPQVYGDLSNVPFSNWNLNFEKRTIVRFEQGLRVGFLEELNSARVRIDSAGTKRASAALGLNTVRNQVAFYGYNDGNGYTYGFLNDPGLPAYVIVATGAGGDTEWSGKTFQEITADIREMVAALLSQSGGNINAQIMQTTLAIALDSYPYLQVTTDFGISVAGWIKTTYPQMRTVPVPQLNDANAGDNAVYLYADMVDDGVSTDDRRTWVQVVPAKFLVIGVSKQTKGYEEDYANATAGAFLKRPYAVVRRYGI